MKKKKRQVKAINIFYEQTLHQDKPQVAAYKNADIPRAMLTEHYVFICELHVLPVVQDKFEYYNVDNIFDATSQSQKWYNNDHAVGKIRFVLSWLHILHIYDLHILFQ